MSDVTLDTAAQVRQWLDIYGAPDADAAWLLVDRHDPSGIAFTQIETSATGDLHIRDITFGELADQSRSLATALAQRGVGRGDSVGVLMGKRAELVVSLLALARLGAVYIPLFTAFATPAIEMRLRGGGANLVITEPSQLSKVDGIDGVGNLVAGPEFDALIAASEPLAESVAVGGNGPLVLLFTSGTTGSPKGVPVPLRALASFHAYLHFGLDISADDVFWNAADPGWAYGLYYGILGPLATGRRNLLLNSGFTPATTVAVMRQLGVTNFAAAPTVYRSLSNDPRVTGLSLRRASSAGEPLTPDVIDWALASLGCEVRDHYGQTEHGMFVNNHWNDAVRKPVVPGSMGFEMPGFTCGIENGEIAIDTATSPLLWFTGYLDAPEKTASRFTGPDRSGWYLTGDAGRMETEPDGGNRFFFTARDDDVIIMAGYRIGPFDVESVLITHPSVIDVAVVGRPDRLRGEVLEAFCVLADGVAGTDELEAELQQLVKDGFAAHAYPRTIHWVEELPKTPSGKIQRFKLRQRED